MGVISRDKEQINCIYTKESDFGKQIQGYLESSNKNILLTDVKDNMPTATQWQELIKELNISIKELIDYAQVEHLDKDSNFDVNDCVTIIQNNPEALRGAIILNGDKTEHITTVTKVLNYFDVDSAGLEKAMHTEKPNIDKTSGKNNFV